VIKEADDLPEKGDKLAEFNLIKLHYHLKQEIEELRKKP